MKNSIRLGASALLLMLGSSADAEVQETRDGYFAIQSLILVDLAPSATYRELIRLSEWWDPAHTWSGSSRNLTLEPRAGGCFCEKLKSGGSVQHARVLFARPGELLRLEGALGPLQEMAVTGVLTFTLAPDGPGTRVTMSYRVAGGLTMEPAKLAPLVDQVMTGQLERLRNFANAKFLAKGLPD
jgi:uncharacterized protein YndB with AHSA1/START domain